jgi:hypothetical protein
MEANRSAPADPLHERDGSPAARIAGAVLVAVLFVAAGFTVLDLIGAARAPDDSADETRAAALPGEVAPVEAARVVAPPARIEGSMRPGRPLPGWLALGDDLALVAPARTMTGHVNDRLSPEPPPAILHDAPAAKARRLYGVFELGELGRRFAYALDAGASPRLYVDRNANGNLRDDGPPLENQGSGYFAAAIALPAALLFERSRGREDFEIWFWTKPEWLAQGRATHYSRTQLRGTVLVDGAPFEAWLVDGDRGDGRFFGDRDILWVDVDRDEAFDEQRDRFGRLAALEASGLREAVRTAR